MKDQALAARCRNLRLVLTDVDGVMTDGTILLLPDGGEARAFNVRDGIGILLARRAGLRIGVVSGRTSETVARRAAELGVDIVRQGVPDKTAALREIVAVLGITASQVAYMGDDVNDLGIMNAVALSAAPADAPFEVRTQAFMVTDARGGRGCLREFLEAILRAREEWDGLVAGITAPGA